MSRYFMIQSWVGSHENEPDYNGQQCGERNVRSSEAVPLYDQYGNANIKAFSDEALEARKKPAVKPKKSVADSIDLAEKHLARMEKLSEELDNEYAEGLIDPDRYEILRYKMDERLIRAFRRLEKENAPIWQKEDREFEEKSLTFNLDEIEWNTAAKNKKKSFKSLAKTADKSAITGQDWLSLALKDCKDSNVFLIGFCAIIKLIKKVKGEI